MHTTLALWIFACLVGFCAFMWALNATTMHYLESAELRERGAVSMPWLEPRGEVSV